MSLKFVPPKEDRKFPRYASYADGVMKTHSTIGAAKLSFNNRGWEYTRDDDSTKRKYVTKHGFILESVNGEWFVRYEIKPGLTSEELPWMEKVYKHRQYRWTYTELPTWGNPDAYTVEYRPHKVTADEYADWRVKVELERLGITAVFE